METTAYRPSRESRALDSDQATTNPQAMPYHLARADRTDLSPHDPIPLFLSDPESEPDPLEFVPLPVRTGSSIATRVVAAVLAASAIAVLAALFHSDVSRLFVVNAKAWMDAAVETSAPSNDPPVVRQIPLKDPARVSNPMQLASADSKSATPPATPSREAIATAYQTALQAQAPVAAPPAPPPPPPARTLDADTLAGLMSRATGLIAAGDIAAARLLLERAANAQDASAAFLLAQTYDPAVLGTRDTRSITADPAAARDWYQKAAQLGSSEARHRLTQLQN